MPAATIKKAAASIKMLQPYFCKQKHHALLTRKNVSDAYLSRSPDLRILSCRTAFSGSLPMTDFRLVRRLHAYSGGTVPDLTRISYSPSALHATDGTQAFMNLCCDYTLNSRLCQERLWYARDTQTLGFFCVSRSPCPVMEQGDLCVGSCRRRRGADGSGVQALSCRRRDDEEKCLKS